MAAGSTDQHRIVTFVDPLTGHARLIIGDDQGVFTGVDDNGTFDTGIGNAADRSGSRNGNLQITQFYYGAVQPSSVAAQIAGDLFYGSAQDNGGPRSVGEVLTRNSPELRRHHLERPRRRRHRRGHRPERLGHRLPVLVALLRRQRHRLLPGQRQSAGPYGLLQQASHGPQRPTRSGRTSAASNFAVNPVNGKQIVIELAGRPDLPDREPGLDLARRSATRPRSDGELRPGAGLRRPRPQQPRRHRQPRQLHLRRHRRRQHLRHPDRRRRRRRQRLDQHHPRRPRRLRRSRRSSPTRPAAATTPTPSPRTASTTSPTRSTPAVNGNPAVPTPLDQHHRQPLHAHPQRLRRRRADQPQLLAGLSSIRPTGGT